MNDRKIMWKFKRLSFLQIFGLLVISIGISTFSGTLQTAEVKSNSEISLHWRGKYDILVRPEASVTLAEAESQLVEGNYLSSSFGGITDQQYNIINNIPGVEVAAPVATVGYLLNETGSVATTIQPFQEDTLYRISWQWISNDLPIQNREPQFAYFAASDKKLSSIFAAGSNSFTDIIGNSETNHVILSLGRFPPQWVLVAGIDPEQEAQLIGLDSTIQQGSYLDNSPLLQGVEISRGLKATKIPILINNKSYINLGLRLDIIAKPLKGNESYLALQSIQGQRNNDGSLTGLDSLLTDGNSILSRMIDLTDQLYPLSTQTIMFSTTDSPSLSNSTEGSLLWGSMPLDTNILLKPGFFDYELREVSPFLDAIPMFRLKYHGTWGDVQSEINTLRTTEFSTDFLESLPAIDDNQLIYRPLEVFSTSSPIIMDIKGIYDISEIQRMIDPLSYAPLGIYEPPEAILKYDPKGKAVNPLILLPGLNPGNFVSRPPLALTNLAAAKLIGGKPDYIDAIRVKISGIDQYSDENLAKVERIAGEIRERTGLHVDIIAGSSPRKVWIDVPEMGYVQENWTTLGTATQISQGINIANGSLLLIMIFSSVLFIINTTNLSLLPRFKEIGILQAVGWRESDLLNRLLSDLTLVGLIGCLFSASFSLLLSLALGLRPSLIVILMTSIIVPVMYICVGIPVILHTIRKNPRELLAYGEYENRVSIVALQKNEFGFLYFTIKQFTRRTKRSLFSLFTFVISIAMLVLVGNILVSLQGSLQVTLMGEFVAFSLRNYHYLMTGIVLIMSIMVVYNNLMLGVVERVRDFQILHTIGWRRKHIFLMIYLESAILAVFAGIIGSIVGSLIFHALTARSSLPDLNITIGSILLSLVIGLVIAINPTRFIGQNLSLSNHQHPQEQQNKLAVRLPLGLVILGLIALVIFVGGKRDVVKSWLTMSSKQPEINPIVGKIDIDSMLNQIQRITNLGPRINNNEAEQKVVRDITSTLNAYGLKTYTERVPLQSLTLLDSNETDILTIPSQEFHILGTASHFMTLQSVDSGKPLPIIFGSQDSLSLSSETLSGKILLLDHSYESIEQAIAQNRDLLSAGFIANVQVDIGGDNFLSSKKDLLGRVGIGEVITAILPGQGKSVKEIWIITHYDSSIDSPGANQSASGVATLCELARLLANTKPTYTIRFIALPGLTNGFSGLIAYLQNHEEETSQVVAAFDISQTGNWGNISVGEFIDDLEGRGIQQEEISSEDLSRIKKDGQYFVRENWQRVIDLDRLDLLNWLLLQRNRHMGLSESPSILRDIIMQAGNLLSIPISRTVVTCPASINILLSVNLPAIAICGGQNDLTGTRYDNFSTVNKENLAIATGLIYQSILDFMGVAK